MHGLHWLLGQGIAGGPLRWELPNCGESGPGLPGSMGRWDLDGPARPCRLLFLGLAMRLKLFFITISQIVNATPRVATFTMY